MTVLDRRITPQVLPVNDIYFLELEKRTLKNGIPVHLINAGSQEVVKIDLIFEAGHWNCNNPLLADFTNRMLVEGSAKYNSAEIAEKFDFLGTFINFECGKHFASAQLYCLSQFVEESIEVFQTYIKNPLFPEKEFNIHLKNEHQQYILARKKTEVLAAEEFYENLFGLDHPYGLFRNQNDFDNITIGQLKEHHQRYYNPANCKIVVSGKLSENIIDLLDKHFGDMSWIVGAKTKDTDYERIKTYNGRYQVEKKDAEQASIRIGKATIDKKSSDFQGLSILNTVLGGYFGSRLMTNLRETNALTYGIYSSLSSLLYAGIFSISANVNKTGVDLAIEQIVKEVNKLRNDLIPQAELDMVKNYLSGEMLRAFDGPLQVSEIYAGLLNYNLDYNYYRSYFETLKSINSITLRDLAHEYLNPDSFVQIVAGDYK